MQSILIFANEILNTITAGTYVIRPVLFLAYLIAVVFATFVLIALQGKIRKPLLNTIWIRTISLTAIGCFSFLFLVNLFLQIFVFSALGISERSVAVAIDKGEITDTRLIHIHFGKVIVAEAFLAPTKSLVLRSDTGRALVPYVPRVLIFLEIAALFIGLITSGLASAFYVSKINGIGRRISAALLAGTLGFLVFEKSVDGGIFSDSAGFALFAYTGLLLMPLARFRKTYPYMIVGYVWVLLLLYVFGFYWPQSYLMYTFERLGILVLLCATGVFGIQGRRTQAMAGAALVLCCISAFIYFNDAGDRTYLNTATTPGSQYISVYAEEAQPAIPFVNRIGDLRVYDVSSLAPVKIENILEKYNLPAAYRPITEGSFVCTKPTLVLEDTFEVLSPKSLVDTGTSDGFYSVAFVRKYPAPAGWYRYQAQLVYNPCVSRYLDVLEQAVKVGGSERAIIYDLNVYKTPNQPVKRNGDK
jgi:hypothetical protein